jgi:TRAP transporter TAXI family solute receptor
MSSSSSAKGPRLLDELRQSRRDVFKVGGPAILAALLAFFIAFYFVEPPPPRQLVIAAGPSDGNYYAVAGQYAQVFEENNVQLTVRETAGSVENYHLLLNEDAVRVAIVQGGTAPEVPGRERLESLCTLYLEPLWLFYREGEPITEVGDLQGKRVAVGETGSGTQVLAEMLLRANAIEAQSEQTEFIYETGTDAASLLQRGEIDAAIFVLSAKSPIVHELLADERLELLSFKRSEAYAQRYAFLEDVTLARGVIDLQGDLPDRDVHLIAPAANLVATGNLHDAFIPLLLESATEAHEGGGLVTTAGEFPSLQSVEFPVNAVARHYLKHGPSAFQKYLGFWISSLIDRTKILLVPLIVLLIPLVKLAPPVYRWRIRSRIYRWYALLREIDQALRSGGTKVPQYKRKLDRIERELEEVNVPLSYMEEFYHLRLHIDLVQRRLAEQQQRTRQLSEKERTRQE